MSPVPGWLARVLADGESVQDTPPVVAASERSAVLAVLRPAFDRHALDVAGPPIAFDPEAAFGAAMALARACWRLVGSESGEAIAADLPGEPASPAAHLSADVTLRFLPAVWRRAAACGASELAAEIDAVLRHWPLSGVLADLDGGPAGPVDFGGHPGLQLLYAERLADAGRSGWVPAAGPGREWVERVYRERGRPVPAATPEE